MSEQYECDNCGHGKLRCELGDIPDLFERIEPGGEVPAGECAKCGCLSYVVKPAKPKLPDPNGLLVLLHRAQQEMKGTGTMNVEKYDQIVVVLKENGRTP